MWRPNAIAAGSEFQARTHSVGARGDGLILAAAGDDHDATIATSSTAAPAAITILARAWGPCLFHERDATAPGIVRRRAATSNR